jgi:tryptophan 2,3-dioxygenase
LELVNAWLERIPFFNEDEIWKKAPYPNDVTNFRLPIMVEENVHPFWAEYRYQYQISLAEAEKTNLDAFDEIFIKPSSIANDQLSLSATASRAALFIMLYRGYPMLQLPFQLLNALLEIDEQLSSWRYRHMNMVHRMIGMRIGTGGSSGKDYLKAAADKHYIFKEIAQLNSFLIERRKLPALPSEIEKHLGFVAV